MAKEKKGKVITITSMKGGTGKTTAALFLASVYENLSKKVLLVDLDLYGGSLAFILNADVKNNIFNICNDMNNNRYKGINGNDYVVHYSKYLDVLAAPKDPRYASKIDKRCLQILLASLASYYDAVIIDTNHIIDVYNMIAFDTSDKIIGIFTNDAVDLKNTKTFVSICKNVGVENLLLVLNESIDYRKGYFSSYDIRQLLKHSIDYILPSNLYSDSYDMYVMDGNLYNRMLKLKSTSKKSYSILEKLALKLLEDKKGADDSEEK
ncbi:MAG: AAA family ATPase [bacterium]|nr:AAA family ATPase [bacterium]